MYEIISSIHAQAHVDVISNYSIETEYREGRKKCEDETLNGNTMAWPLCEICDSVAT